MPRAKRSVKDGFPITARFESREAINHYLSGDKVTCLLCGHSFRILDSHLRAVHAVTSDEYREKYGLPYMRGLCASDFSEQRVEHGKALFEKDPGRHLTTLLQSRGIRIGHGSNPQRSKPQFWKDERTKYDRAIYEEFIRRVVAGRAVSDVRNDPDMPTTTNVYWYMKRDPEFAKRWKTVIRVAAPVGKRRVVG